MRNRDLIGIDNITWECDYPHSDSTWPKAPETLWASLAGVPDDDIHKITWRNTTRHFQYDPFKHIPKEQCTVGALRAQAKDVDLTPRVGAGGKQPSDYAHGYCTIGDIMKQMAFAFSTPFDSGKQKVTDGATKQSPVTLDLSDVDPRVGQLVGGGQLWEPCSATDIRRWVHAMDYPNPIHWDQEFARKSKFGGIVAPQSFVVCMDYGHGVHPACVGRIPGSHLIFGGEEWWFYGPRIRPGDRLTPERRFHGYKVTDTKFAGPTMFSSGDTVHTNQHGAPVAKERSTSIRYLAAEAEKRGFITVPCLATRLRPTGSKQIVPGKQPAACVHGNRRFGRLNMAS